MRRIAAALALIIARLLPAAPALPVHAQAAPGTLLSISPASGVRGSTVNVVIEAGSVQPPYSSALATSPATLVTTRFAPVEPCAPVGLQGSVGCSDLQVLGAVTADVASARFYFADRCLPSDPCAPLSVCQPSEPCIPVDPCTPSDPVRPVNSVRLLFFNDVSQTWATACSSGNRAVTVDATPNLDGTVSALRISAVFDSTSTPTITALGGTQFAAVLVDTAAPTSTATPKPGPLPAGPWRPPVPWCAPPPGPPWAPSRPSPASTPRAW